MRSEVTNVSYGDRCICRKSRDSDNIKDVIPTTRVYKKSSPSGKLTCYIGYREVYSDLLTSSDDNECDFLEGAILLNADDNCVYTVYLNLQATLRFGIPNRSSRNKRTTAAAATATNQHLSNRHHFQSSVALYTQNQRVNIVSTSSPGPPTLAGLTLLQQRLLKKLGPTARPFLFKLRKSSPFSSQIVMRRRAVNPIASSSSISSSLVPTRCLALVDYELRVSMVAGMSDSTALAVVNEHRLLRQRSPTSVPILIDLDSLMGASANKRNALRLSIRKLAIASPLNKPSGYLRLPSAEIRKHFFLSHAPLNVECTLDKSVVYHDERNINVNVNISNNSNRTIKSITIELVQYSQVFLPSSSFHNNPKKRNASPPNGSATRTLNVIASASKFKAIVSRIIDSNNGLPITPCMTFSRVYALPFGAINAVNGLAPSDMSNNSLRNVLVLDGPPNNSSTCLAASTQLFTGEPSDPDGFLMNRSPAGGPFTGSSGGIAVKYKVRVKLNVSMSNDVRLVLPLHLTHRPTRRLLATCPVHHKHSKALNCIRSNEPLQNRFTHIEEDDLIKFESDDQLLSASDDEDDEEDDDDRRSSNNNDNDNIVQSLETFARSRLNG